MSPVMAELGMVLICVFANMAKLPAVPRFTGIGPAERLAPVLKLQVLAEAKGTPFELLAAVLMVAVNNELLVDWN